jgi:hypothetical protein
MHVMRESSGHTPTEPQPQPELEPRNVSVIIDADGIFIPLPVRYAIYIQCILQGGVCIYNVYITGGPEPEPELEPEPECDVSIMIDAAGQPRPRDVAIVVASDHEPVERSRTGRAITNRSSDHEPVVQGAVSPLSVIYTPPCKLHPVAYIWRVLQGGACPLARTALQSIEGNDSARCGLVGEPHFSSYYTPSL